ncbi:MAG: DNRLRE domain-containing protein, partial [Alphaproteobacteria bacterium]
MVRAIYPFIGWILLCLAYLPNAHAESATLQPGPDDGKDIWTTSVYSYAPGGGGPGGGLNDEYLVTGGWGDTYLSLIEFDLTGLPQHATSAELVLRVAQSRSGSFTGLYLDRITEPWDWKTSGTGSDNDRLWWADRPSTTNESGPHPAPSSLDFYSIDITDLYNQWQDGTHANYGLQLRPTNTNNNWSEFFSSDYLVDPSFRPKLVVNYTPADYEAPILTDLVFSPQSIDTGQGDQQIAVSVSFTDDASGLKFIRLVIDDPSGSNFTERS